MTVAVALVTCRELPEGPEDERSLGDALEARGVRTQWLAWDDPSADWVSFDLVLVRSPWDYVDRREELLGWAAGVGARLHNSAEVLTWTTDKRYLVELDAAGLPVVPTTLLEPGDPVNAPVGEVVVKPAVSAGARDTGRFADPAAAQAHAERLLARGRPVLIQPYLSRVDDEGEIALVLVDGTLSHAMRKRPVLREDGVAPAEDVPGRFGAASAMFEPDLMTSADASPAERALAVGVAAYLTRRFGSVPLYARVDLLARDDGTPAILEVELAEPALWLDANPGSGERLASALLARSG